MFVFIKRHARTEPRQQSGKLVSLNVTNVARSSHCQSFFTLALQNFIFIKQLISLCSLWPLPLQSLKVTAFWPGRKSILGPSGFVSPTNLIIVEIASKKYPTKKMWSSCTSDRKAIVYSFRHEKSFCKCSYPE